MTTNKKVSLEKFKENIKMKNTLIFQVNNDYEIKQTDSFFYISVTLRNKNKMDIGWINDVFDELKFKKEIGEYCTITNVIKCKDIHEYNKLKFSK